jgi:hypothetical protein
MSAASIGGGALAGGVGGVSSSVIQQTGNGFVFGDPFSGRQVLYGAVGGAALGAVSGAIGNRIINARLAQKGMILDKWSGKVLTGTASADELSLQFPLLDNKGNPVFDSDGKRLLDAARQVYSTPPGYPPNMGMVEGSNATIRLNPGMIINRYGGTAGSRCFSPEGTPNGLRAMPDASINESLRRFQVMKPFEVDAGIIRDWNWGSGIRTGGGWQFTPNQTLGELMETGYLLELGP